MKDMKMLQYRCMAAVLLMMGSSSLNAQNKFTGTYQTDPEVVVELQANHTNVIVEPWNRNEVAVEAYLEKNDLTEEENAQILKTWSFETKASPSYISLRSTGGSGFVSRFDFPSMSMRPLGIPEMLNPLLEQISKHPVRSEVFQRLRDMEFDFEAYSRDGDDYLAQWEKDVKERMGDDVEIQIHTWQKVPQDTLVGGAMRQQMREMDQFLEQQRSRMENQMGLAMDQWTEQFQKQVQRHQEQFQNRDNSQGSGSKLGKTIKVRIPENARLVMRVRHGEVELAGEIHDLKADISYAPFTAKTLSGKNTLLKSSYAPVSIGKWKYGELHTSYTPICEIGTVESLRLSSNSSDLKIGKILNTALLAGTFGKIEVKEVAKGFHLLDLSLNNSDLNLQLPNAPLDFAYHGSQSEIKYPEAFKVDKTQSYDSEILKTRNRSGKGNGSISIRAQYSNVDIQL